MKLQQLLSYTRRAIDDYQMIEDGDKIAIGVSGGKDSLTLLYALKGLQRFYPKKFELMAITVDLGFENFNTETIKELCTKLEIPYEIVHTNVAEIVFEERNENNPCSLCAKMRKGALNETAKAHGFSKIAYAHHKDDVVETMLLSLIFEGRFHTFAPKTYLERMELDVIRPMIYVPEADVIGFTHKYNLSIAKSPCPADGHTKREYIKNLLKQLNREHPGCKERMFTAIVNGIWNLT